MGGTNNVAVGAWFIAILGAWAASFELGTATTIGYASQWLLKGPSAVRAYVAYPAIVALSVGGYFVLHHPIGDLEPWVKALAMFTLGALGAASTAGNTGGAPKTNSI